MFRLLPQILRLKVETKVLAQCVLVPAGRRSEVQGYLWTPNEFEVNLRERVYIFFYLFFETGFLCGFGAYPL